MFAPKVTLFNGQTATVLHFVSRPFVISVVPTVGIFSTGFQPVISLVPRRRLHDGDGGDLRRPPVCSAHGLPALHEHHRRVHVLVPRRQRGRPERWHRRRRHVGGRASRRPAAVSAAAAVASVAAGGGGFGIGGGMGTSQLVIAVSLNQVSAVASAVVPAASVAVSAAARAAVSGGSTRRRRRRNRDHRPAARHRRSSTSSPPSACPTAAPCSWAASNGSAKAESMAGVPILNKIPYISRLFKNTGVGAKRKA